MSVAFIFNIILIILLIAFVVAFFMYKIKKTEEKSDNNVMQREKEKYSIETMRDYIKISLMKLQG